MIEKAVNGHLTLFSDFDAIGTVRPLTIKYSQYAYLYLQRYSRFDTRLPRV